jgi:hypothetical protein
MPSVYSIWMLRLVVWLELLLQRRRTGETILLRGLNRYVVSAVLYSIGSFDHEIIVVMHF